jgi:hypothetical protein
MAGKEGFLNSQRRKAMAQFTAPRKKDKNAGLNVEVTRKKRTQTVKEEPIQYNGLCITCIHTETCGFRRDVSQPVIECDEFDIGKTPEVVFEAGAVAEKPTEEYKGLCVNCDLRYECKFPRTAEGVWHCEEYI